MECTSKGIGSPHQEVNLINFLFIQFLFFEMWSILYSKFTDSSKYYRTMSNYD